MENIGAVPQYDQSGRGGLEPTRVQFDIWSSNYAKGRQTFNILRDFLDPETEAPARTQGGTTFERFLVEEGRDLPVTDLSGGGRVFHIAADVIIWHRGAVQT